MYIPLLMFILASACIWLVMKNWPTNPDVCVHDWSKWKTEKTKKCVTQTRTCSKCGIKQTKGISV